jgi:hypothetical protein
MHYRPSLLGETHNPENHGKSWQPRDLHELVEAWKTGESLVETAAKLGRRVEACLLKLRGLQMCGIGFSTINSRFVVREAWAERHWAKDSPILKELVVRPEWLERLPNLSAPRSNDTSSAVRQMQEGSLKVAEAMRLELCSKELKELFAKTIIEIVEGLKKNIPAMYSTEGEDLTCYAGSTSPSFMRFRKESQFQPIAILQGETTMKIDTLNIETKTFINGVDVDTICDDTLLHMLQTSKAKQSSMEAMSNALASFHANASKEQTDKLEQIINDRAEKRKQEAEKAGK